MKDVLWKGLYQRKKTTALIDFTDNIAVYNI